MPISSLKGLLKHKCCCTTIYAQDIATILTAPHSSLIYTKKLSPCCYTRYRQLAIPEVCDEKSALNNRSNI